MQISWYNVNSWKVRKLTWYYIFVLCWEQWCFILNKYVQLNDSSIWHLQMFTCKVKHFYTHFCTWLLTLLMFNYVYTQVYTHVYTNDYTHFYTQEKENFTQRHPPSQPSAHICTYRKLDFQTPCSSQNLSPFARFCQDQHQARRRHQDLVKWRWK